MKCSSCGSKQSVGKFCGKCGGKLISASNTEPGIGGSGLSGQHQKVYQAQANRQTKQETAATASNTSQTNSDSLEKVKETSKAYGGFFKEYLKHPSRIFTKQSKESTNGFISIGIVLLLIILTFNVMINNAFGDYSYFKPSFATVFFNSLIYLGIMLAIVVTILFFINKLFGTDCTYKDMISIFGIHMTPVAIVAAISFVLSILKSNNYAAFFLLIAISLMISLIPLYIISSLLTRRSKGIDPLYGYLLYVVAVGITFSVVVSIMVDSAIGNMINDFGW